MKCVLIFYLTICRLLKVRKDPSFSIDLDSSSKFNTDLFHLTQREIESNAYSIVFTKRIAL